MRFLFQPAALLPAEHRAPPFRIWNYPVSARRAVCKVM